MRCRRCEILARFSSKQNHKRITTFVHNYHDKYEYLCIIEYHKITIFCHKILPTQQIIPTNDTIHRLHHVNKVVQTYYSNKFHNNTCYFLVKICGQKYFVNRNFLACTISKLVIFVPSLTKYIQINYWLLITSDDFSPLFSSSILVAILRWNFTIEVMMNVNTKLFSNFAAVHWL